MVPVSKVAALFSISRYFPAEEVGAGKGEERAVAFSAVENLAARKSDRKSFEFER